MAKSLSLVYWPLLMTLSAVTMAQVASVDIPDPVFDQRVDTWDWHLNEVERKLEAPSLSRERIKALLEIIHGVRQDAVDMGRMAAAEAKIARRMLTALGPAPPAGEPEEDLMTRAERRQIKTQITRYESRYKRCQLILARIDLMIEHIAAAEKEIILRAMTERVPWSFDMIPTGLLQLRDRLERSWHELTREWNAASLRKIERLLALGAILLLGLLAIGILRRWLLRRYGRDSFLQAPQRRRQLSACVMELMANGLLPASFIIVALIALQSELRWSDSLSKIINVILLSGLQWVLIIAAVAAVLAPHHPQWRLNNLSDTAATGLYRSLLWLLLVAILLRIFGTLLNPNLSEDGWIFSEDAMFAFFASQQHASILLGSSGLLLNSLLTLQVLRPRHWRFLKHDETTVTVEEGPPGLSLRILLGVARLSIIGCLLLGFAGYIGAGLLIYVRVFWTLITVGLLWCLQHLISESLFQVTLPDSRMGARLRQHLGLGDTDMERLAFWLRFLINTLVWVSAIVLLLLIWGVPKAYLERLYAVFIDGFAIGGLWLSPVTIGSALAVFALLLAGVHFLRNFLSQRVLVQTRLDVGVRDALTTVSGYIGVFIAVLVALTVLGIDFGKMALVLGGLSVGIGLGLQHIVNNFLSGLILLFQRPIKAGDWVVVGKYQGYVKRINVIATEIETFDNASVLVPNSTMASTEVLNWTHRSTLGRVIVAVGVSYDSDPDQVKAILLACAEAHPEIVSKPEPRVFFQNFGDSALEFDVRFYIREIDNLLRVASEMRFAIRNAFAEAGIAIPFPQHDVHLYQAQSAVTQEDLAHAPQ